VLQHGFEELEQASICAVVSRDNETSIKLLGKLGFHYSDQIRMDPKGDRIDLYTIERKA
jgi:RimJ/RimL family protein N-acetyltransferase